MKVEMKKMKELLLEENTIVYRENPKIIYR